MEQSSAETVFALALPEHRLRAVYVRNQTRASSARWALVAGRIGETARRASRVLPSHNRSFGIRIGLVVLSAM